MNKDDLNQLNVILTDASGFALALQDLLYDLIENLDPADKQSRAVTVYDVIRSRDTYRALITGIADKLIDSRRLLEAGMNEDGDNDAKRS